MKNVTLGFCIFKVRFFVYVKFLIQVLKQKKPIVENNKRVRVKSLKGDLQMTKKKKEKKIGVGVVVFMIGGCLYVFAPRYIAGFVSTIAKIISFGFN